MPYADPEERKRYRKEYAERNRESLSEYQKAYRTANAGKAREYQREYSKEYYHSKLKHNPEYVQEMRKRAERWYLENTERAKLNAKAHCVRRRDLIGKVTPAWANMESVKAIYALAMKLTEETGIKHEVDHIVPLRGKNVQGLHCEANLRVITMAENRQKGSSHTT